MIAGEAIIENSNDGRNSISFPFTENFKEIHKIGKPRIPYLFLIEDRTGNIPEGNVVLYKPNDERKDYKVSDITPQKFCKDNDGIYKILNVWGVLAKQVDIEKIKSNHMVMLQKLQRM